MPPLRPDGKTVPKKTRKKVKHDLASGGITRQYGPTSSGRTPYVSHSPRAARARPRATGKPKQSGWDFSILKQLGRAAYQESKPGLRLLAGGNEPGRNPTWGGLKRDITDTSNTLTGWRDILAGNPVAIAAALPWGKSLAAAEKLADLMHYSARGGGMARMTDPILRRLYDEGAVTGARSRPGNWKIDPEFTALAERTPFADQSPAQALLDRRTLFHGTLRPEEHPFDRRLSRLAEPPPGAHFGSLLSALERVGEVRGLVTAGGAAGADPALYLARIRDRIPEAARMRKAAIGNQAGELLYTDGWANTIAYLNRYAHSAHKKAGPAGVEQLAEQWADPLEGALLRALASNHWGPVRKMVKEGAMSSRGMRTWAKYGKGGGPRAYPYYNTLEDIGSVSWYFPKRTSVDLYDEIASSDEWADFFRTLGRR